MKFFVDAPNFIPSFDPNDSDVIRNAVAMEQLVGTLVKERFGNTGRSEPFLAKEWLVENNSLSWTFTFRQGLYCEDSSPINATTFSQSLHFRLKTLAKFYDVPTFNRLVGWSDFVSNKALLIEGIKILDTYRLQLNFRDQPDGLLEYLAMSTFGHYSTSDFTNHKWNNRSKITSSGSYRIKSLNSDSLVLEKRQWPLTVQSAPKKVEYFYQEAKSVARAWDEFSIFPVLRIPHNFDEPRNATKTKGSLIMLTALVLSPNNGIFKSIENRQQFRSAFNEITERFVPDRANAIRATSFYASKLHKSKQSSIPSAVNLGLTPIKVGFDLRHDSPELQFVIRSIQESATKLGLTVELSPFDYSEPDWLQKQNDNSYFDIRIATVDIGTSPENWVIEMMFCSKLGISFPDPSGDICKLAANFKSSIGHFPEQQYVAELEDIIWRDSSVVPVFHSGYTWYVGKNLSFPNLSATSVVPRIELIQEKP